MTLRKRMVWKGRAQTGKSKADLRTLFAIPMTSPSAVADFADQLRAVGMRLEVGVEGSVEDLDDNLVAMIRDTYKMGRMAARYRTRRLRQRGETLQRLAEAFAKNAVKLNRDFEQVLAALEDDEERQAAKQGKKTKRTVRRPAFTLDD
ncbi:hypothetical protein [Nonomuraea typhae]|uniref:hypothetical protein n=1 Tax=Nonomuraea typhae TaxID=2603600 RepID=UPI0012FC3C89|nr:hypothetical protein [Nonomuraea typhae]